MDPREKNHVLSVKLASPRELEDVSWLRFIDESETSEDLTEASEEDLTETSEDLVEPVEGEDMWGPRL